MWLRCFACVLIGTATWLSHPTLASTRDDTPPHESKVSARAADVGDEDSTERCRDAYTPIYTIQGSGPTSPLVGDVVSTEGIIVGDFQQGGFKGFYLQDSAGDADAATSDGIFVYAPDAPDVDPGDSVRVRGSVDEFAGETEIARVRQVTRCSTGHALAPIAIRLPASRLDAFEAFEGMLVTIPQTLFISGTSDFDRFGELVLSTQRQFQPTARAKPGSPQVAELSAANQLGRIALDDGRSAQNPDPARHPDGAVFDRTHRFRAGDGVANVTGVMDGSFGLQRIQPTRPASYRPLNPRPVRPDPVGGDLKIASFNVLNYFTTLDSGGRPRCGPAADRACRGADNAKELTRQRDKLLAALVAIDADVVGLLEIENAPSDAPTADLVSGLNDRLGAGTYAAIATGAIGTDAIRPALIYRPAKVSPQRAHAILDASVDPRFRDTKNRPVLAQTFRDHASGDVFTLAVAHLKSKGSDCTDVGDPDRGDGAGNCNRTRKTAVEAIVDWLATDPTHSGRAAFLVIGDLNAYAKEEPIEVLVAAGYRDLLREYVGEDAYSYSFDGQLGSLDYAFASPGLRGAVTGATVWHINADEPDILDYDTSFKRPAQEALYEPDAYRSSDHDPLIVGLALRDAVAPSREVSDEPDILSPEHHAAVSAPESSSGTK